MTELTLEEIKKSTLESMCIFRDFCDKNHLKYYIISGTLLGAVRHKGFIPWDDDADVIMPREDYTVFAEHFNETIVQNREVITKEICPEYYRDFARIIDKNTSVIEARHSLELGVWLDVFPMDYLVDDEALYKRTNRKIAFLNRCIHYATIVPSKKRPAYKNVIIRVLHLILPPKERMLKRKEILVNKITSAEKSHTYGLFYRDFGKVGVPRIPTRMFEPFVNLTFEGELFRAPKEYDTLLRWCYGNYWTLPPVNKRRSHKKDMCVWKEEREK